MSGFFATPTIVPRHGHQTPQSTLSLRHARAAVGTFNEFVRNPASTISKFLDGTSLLSSAEPLRASQDPDAARTLLRFRLQGATSLDDWRVAASQLDEIEGNNIWKSEHISSEYDYGLVQSRLDQLNETRISGDASRMLFLIRTCLARHLGGMGNTLLYSHSHIGTKRLIEEYIKSALATLNALVEITHLQPASGLNSRDVLQQVLKTRQAFGRSALLLSGGGTFGMNHIGVVKCLWENKLLPRIISGASAGSIVCAVLCTRTDEELPVVLREFCNGDLEVFTKTGVDDGVLHQVARFLKSGALFDISNLTRIMKNMLGDLTFQEAYNRTRRILNICVSSASLFELPRLLNYITAPNVIIWSAVAASCSVPLIYSPAGLLSKGPKTGMVVPWNFSPQRWIDGSVDNDLPMTRLAEMFNVNHFIVSQVNPHVVPFLAKEEVKCSSDGLQNDSVVDAGPGWINVLTNLAKDEAMHRMHVLSELGVMSNLLTKTRSVLSQRYSGDITIFPEVSFAQLPKVLANPTSDFMFQANLYGERATWPRLSRIQNHCAIELALDDAVQQLRARIAFSPSQVDLRMNAIGRSASHTAPDDTINSKPRNNRNNSRTYQPNAGATKDLRTSSSSESDTQRPSLPSAPDTNPPQPPAKRKAPVSFHLELETNADVWARQELYKDSELVLSPGMETSESEEDNGDGSWNGHAATPVKRYSLSASAPRPARAHARAYASQPQSPAAHAKSQFSYDVGNQECPASTSLPASVKTFDALHRTSIDDDAPAQQSFGVNTDVTPIPEKRRRSLSTGLRWLTPPGDGR